MLILNKTKCDIHYLDGGLEKVLFILGLLPVLSSPLSFIERQNCS